MAVAVIVAASVARAESPDLTLCRQQLANLHDAADTADRDKVLSEAALEAQKATLIEWLKAAQAKERKK